jgi:hypothetical protein
MLLVIIFKKPGFNFAHSRMLAAMYAGCFEMDLHYRLANGHETARRTIILPILYFYRLLYLWFLSTLY